MNRERRRGGCGTGDSNNDDDDRFELEDEEDQQLRDDGRLSKSKWRMTRRRSLSLLGSDDVDQYIVGGLERDFAIHAGARSRLSSSSSKFHRFLFRPDNRWYVTWTHLMVIFAVYSSFFTPFEFGFFRGLPENLFLLDVANQIAFFIDIIVHFFVVYRDHHSYHLVYNPNLIALRSDS
ncbi:hypothetical protein QYF36_008340 [Acer negundo]|nr:hypothetical protein QYF36_008340 [Acer negundo]